MSSELKILSDNKPSFRDIHDAVAFLLHASMLKSKFRCVGVTDAVPTQDAKEMSAVPEGWNRSEDAYCFQYRLPEDYKQNESRVLMKFLRMEQSLLIHAVRKGGTDDNANKSFSLDLNVGDHVKSDVALDQYDKLYRDAAGLITLFEQSIKSKLLPPPPVAAAPEHDQRARDPNYDPLRIDRPRPRFDDPRINPDGRPFVPAGEFNPFAPGPFGGGELMGPGNFGLGPNPMFGPPGGGIPGGPGVPFPGRGRGARFDPYGPFPGSNDPDPDILRRPGGRPFGPGGGGFPDII